MIFRPVLFVASTAFVLSGRVVTSFNKSNPYKRKYITSILKMNNKILESPSAERNKAPIYDQVLATNIFPRLIKDTKSDKIKVLELAAGCGVHTIHFVQSFLASNKELGIEWHPSDPDVEARESIDARIIQSGLEKSIVNANGWILGKSGGTACGDGDRGNVDAGANNSGRDGDVAVYEKYHNYFDLVLCINMIHISPWEATLGLMACAGNCLKKNGILMCYGPYKVGGTAVESNLRFDESLKSRNSEWGVRNIEDVIDAAKKEGLTYVDRIEMPANNMSVLFRKD